MRIIYRLLTIIITLFLIGCGSALPTVKPYKIDIQQGNAVTSEMLLKLRPGMTKSQVKFIMGTPLLIDSFRTNRWDYFYQLRKDGKIVKQHRVILDFENDLLKRVRGDVVPKGQTVEDVTRKLQEEAEAKKSQEAASQPLPIDNEEPKVLPIEAPAAEVTDQAAESAADAVEENLPPSVVAVPPAAHSLADDGEVNPVPDVPSEPEVQSAAQEQAAEVQPVVEKVEPTEQQMEAMPAEKETAKPTQEPVMEKAEEAFPSAASAAAAVAVEENMTAPVDSAVEPTPETPSAPQSPSAVKNDMRVFRLDRSLDTSRIKPLSEAAKPAGAESAVTEVIESTEDAPAEEDPGFFERMLEKIGF